MDEDYDKADHYKSQIRQMLRSEQLLAELEKKKMRAVEVENYSHAKRYHQNILRIKSNTVDLRRSKDRTAATIETQNQEQKVS